MKGDCVILGLLQNQWVRQPARVKAILAGRDAAYRRRYLGVLLFVQSVSGRRLRKAFGELCERIVWENASPIIASRANANPAPDLDHVRQALAEVQPEIVLAFGRHASQTMRAISWQGILIEGPHPAARTGDVEQRLMAMCRKLEPYNEDQT